MQRAILEKINKGEEAINPANPINKIDGTKYANVNEVSGNTLAK